MEIQAQETILGEVLEGHKVLEAREMIRIERESLERGGREENYMLRAGEGVAKRAEALIRKEGYSKTITLLVGKGNNGGDAFAAGAILLKKGYRVQGYHSVESTESCPLCRKQEHAFLMAGGTVIRGEVPPLEGLVIDGLLGTGFEGQLTPRLQEVIQRANASRLPILSIDLPSGVNGNTGEVGSIAIRATETAFLGAPKLGCFLGKGYEYSGNFFPIDFGLSPKDLEQANGKAFLIKEEEMCALLPPLIRTRHKYEAGYVLALAGSSGMAGAALLACLSALRSGAGIVRLFHPHERGQKWSVEPLEVMRTPDSYQDPTFFLEESKRAKACLIGPGIGKDKTHTSFIQKIVSTVTVPVVLDADAFFHIQSFPKGGILTPHAGEVKQLLKKEMVSHKDCQTFANAHEVTLVLKGAPTWIFHPETLPLISVRGDPGMATAGAGDVLTGIIAALLAQGIRGRNAAALGVFLHGLSGEMAARERTSYSLIASDLIDFLPEAFRTITQLQ